MTLPVHSGPWPLIQYRNHISQTVGFLGRVISPSQGRYLNTGQHKHRINTYTYQISMPWVGFKPTIPASKWAKTVHALDRAATVTGTTELRRKLNWWWLQTRHCPFLSPPVQHQSPQLDTILHHSKRSQIIPSVRLDICLLFSYRSFKCLLFQRLPHPKLCNYFLPRSSELHV
jgi:hypothetical protein